MLLFSAWKTCNSMIGIVTVVHHINVRNFVNVILERNVPLNVHTVQVSIQA